MSDDDLTAAEQRFWLFEQIEPGQPCHHVTSVLRLSGPLVRGRLEDAVRTVARRHENLRVQFYSVGGKPRAWIGGAADTVELQYLPRPSEAQTAGAILGTHTAAPFDLASGSLMRAGLMAVDEREHLLVLTVHHIVADKASMAVIVGEIGRLYISPADFGALPPAPTRAEIVRVTSRGAAHDDPSALEYWRHELADLPTAPDLAGAVRAPDDFHGREHHIDLDAFAPGLQNAARSAKATMTAFLLAAFVAALQSCARFTELVVVVPVSLRADPRLDNAVGCLVNTLPVRVRSGSAGDFDGLLRSVRKGLASILKYSEIPVDLLAREIAGRHAGRYHPFGTVCFQVLRYSEYSEQWGDLEVQPYDESFGTTTRFDIEMHVRERGNRTDAVLSSSTSIADGFVGDLIIAYRAQLARVAAKSGEALSELGATDFLTPGSERGR